MISPMNNFEVRAVIALASIIFLLIFAAPMLHRIINLGNICGFGVSLIILLYCIFYNRISLFVRHISENKTGKAIVIAVNVVIIITLITAFLITFFIVKAANDKPESKNTTLIILGCKVKDGQPSQMLKRRLNTAYDYLIENPDVKVIVSGGKGTDEIISEAQCMHDYLTKKGISENRIITESASTSTRENLEFSKKLIAEYELPQNITIVTDGYHQLRAEMIAKNYGYKSISNLSAPTALWLLPTYYVRELFGVTHQFITGG